jgi:hypothetical protein
MKYLVFFLIIFSLISCDQDPDFEYIRENILEAYLIVGEPITEVRLSKTLPLNEKYSFDNAAIKDANIIINDGENNLILYFNDSTLKYNYDSNYLVKAQTQYSIRVELENGEIIEDTTRTPSQIEWLYALDSKVVKFPIDSLNPQNSNRIAWDYPGTLLSINLIVKCLDTLNYGKYFDDFNISEETNELNRRIERPWRDDLDFKDPLEYVIIAGATDSTTVVWSTFKFYGLHEVAVFAPDLNWTSWGLQYYRGQYFDPLSTVSGDGLGTLASASVIRDTFFLVKNQP